MLNVPFKSNKPAHAHQHSSPFVERRRFYHGESTRRNRRCNHRSDVCVDDRTPSIQYLH